MCSLSLLTMLKSGSLSFMSYRASFAAINDWSYMDRLLTGKQIVNRHTTPAYCWALINDDGIYRWWKLRRKDYKLLKETTTTKFI